MAAERGKDATTRLGARLVDENIITGEQLQDAVRMAGEKKISRTVKRGCQARSFAIPRHTAFDVLDIVSRKVPEPGKVKLDITRLDIKPGKTYLKGTADSRSAVGDIVKTLEEHECFSKVTSGKISDVSEGKKQFSLTITTECF